MDKITVHFSQIEEGMTLMDRDEIGELVRFLKQVKMYGGTVYVFGNGGSHSTAGHFANDLAKMCRIKALCVGEMQASMLAYGNDTGWENMFYGPLKGMVGPNDGLFGISCSGNSENVIKALKLAQEFGVISAGMTGMSDSSAINKLGLDALVHARVDDIRVQEDLHLMLCHAVVREIQESE